MMYKTGDLVRISDNGILEFLGRITKLKLEDIEWRLNM